MSFKGAKQVIAMLAPRRQVTKLFLGHNSLSDSGCVELFHYLSSPEGKKYRLKEISLNANEIGNVGLEAIAKYINGNTELVELFLQNVCASNIRSNFIGLTCLHFSRIIFCPNREV